MALQAAVAILGYYLPRAAGLHNFTAPETEGLSTIIVLLGNVYAVMFAFAMPVIWGQFTDVERSIFMECICFRPHRFGSYVHTDAARSIQSMVTDYMNQVGKFVDLLRQNS